MLGLGPDFTGEILESAEPQSLRLSSCELAQLSSADRCTRKVGSAQPALDVDQPVAEVGDLAVDTCERSLVPRGVAGALVGVVPSHPDHLVTPETAAATASGNPAIGKSIGWSLIGPFLVVRVKLRSLRGSVLRGGQGSLGFRSG
jgi:hypothetical protein